MRSKWCLFLPVVAASIFFIRSAAALTLGEVVAKLQQQQNTTATMVAHFTQTAYSKALNQYQKAEGTVYIKKPGMMRWDYAPPEEQLFVINDETFWWYTPHTKQVIKKRTETAFDSPLPLAFLNGMGELAQNFNIQFATGEHPPGGYALELVPKKPQVNLKKMVLLVDEEQFYIRQVVMYDFYDNVTTLDFSQHKINTPIADELFEFEVPLGVQVVE
jgi:outer membrane lipoprotein carrier protein